MKHRPIRTVGAMLLAAGAVTGCTALLGSFDVASGDVGPQNPDGPSSDGPVEGSVLDGGGDTTVPVVCTAPEVACNNVCARLTMSADNCGKCGHSCGGGTCTASVCGPFKIYDGSQTDAGTVTVSSIDVGDVDVYFGGSDGNTQNKLYGCPKSGCKGAPRQLASMGYPVRTVAVVPKGTVVFESAPTQSTERPALYACSVVGCAAVPAFFAFAGLQSFEGRLRSFGDRIFLAEQGVGLGWSQCNPPAPAPAGSCATPPNFLANTKGAHGFAADANNIYYIDSAFRVPATPSTISMCPQDVSTPCTPTTLTPGDNNDVPGLVVFNSKLYWLKPGRVDFNEGKLLSCDLPGCAVVKPLANGLDSPTELIADASGQYWLTKGSKLQHCLPTDCIGGARDFAGPLDTPHSIVSDDAFVYWAEKTSVWGLAK